MKRWTHAIIVCTALCALAWTAALGLDRVLGVPSPYGVMAGLLVALVPGWVAASGLTRIVNRRSARVQIGAHSVVLLRITRAELFPSTATQTTPGTQHVTAYERVQP